jgi:excisionase family DNA binding protein
MPDRYGPATDDVCRDDDVGGDRSGTMRPWDGGGSVVFLLSVAEAAKALNLGRSKTYELIAAGELEVVHIGRCSRVPVDAVEAFVRRLRTANPPR